MLVAGCVSIALPLRAQVIEYSPTLSSVAAPLPADDMATGNGLITGQFGANTAPFDYAIHLSIRGAYDDTSLQMHRLIMSQIDECWNDSRCHRRRQIWTMRKFLMFATRRSVAITHSVRS